MGNNFLLLLHLFLIFYHLESVSMKLTPYVLFYYLLYYKLFLLLYYLIQHSVTYFARQKKI